MDKKERLAHEVGVAWERLEGDIRLYGSADEITRRSRTMWYALDKAWRIMFPDESY